MTKDSLYCIFDMETDGYLEEVTLIRCLSYQIYHKGNIIEKGTFTDYDEIRKFFTRDFVIVGHKIISYDIPVLVKILGVIIKNELIDTLGLSWYLFPNRKIHGLDAWGKEVGIEKPKIDDWKNLTLQEYIYRCEEDVRINVEIFKVFLTYLNEIYVDFNLAVNIIDYISFKLDCLREQEECKIKLDVPKTHKHIEDLQPMFDQKYNILSSIMPKKLGKILKKKPVTTFKQDGTLSVYGEKWFNYLKENNLPEDLTEIREAPNPGSDVQLKTWLFQLGWKPITFKISKTTKEKIPQVSLPFGAGICPSVQQLYEVEPQLEELDSYFKIKHRIGLFQSYLDNEVNGYVVASAQGFTNTMRLKHSKPVVNLPKPGVFYGKECREVLIAPEGHIMCGSDVSGLEDNTKQHYIYFYDPKYVDEMRVPGFDAHIDIGVLAGLISREEEEFFKKTEAMSDEEKALLTDEEKTLLKSIKKRRGVAKSTNFAATYGAGGPKIAETAKVSLQEGYELHKIYWQRNLAVKKTANACTVKQVNGQSWLYNPISGFWMFLKAEKDRFSTLNQSSGVFVFDSWLRKVRQKLNPFGIKIPMQYHDELMTVFLPEYKDYVSLVLKESMDEVNKQIKLNITISVSIDFGYNYAEVH